MKHTFAFSLTAALCSTALAWDASGHRTITWLALDALPADAPAFLREQATREAVTWNAAEPDRWRGEKNPFIMNSTYMDHFIDVEDLEAFDMTLDTMPMLRYRYVGAAALARQKWPAGKDGNSKPYDAKKDQSGQQEYPGFVAHAICEQQARLTSQFKTWRMLQKLNDPARAAQITMAEANIMSTMGVLAHVAGDTSQPLHTTRHYNGWAADVPNPEGYTVNKGFHAMIDGGLIKEFGIDYDVCKAVAVKQASSAGSAMNAKDPASAWGYTIAYVKRSHERVLPLYKLEKSGTLHGPAGRSFIIDCLNDGGATLGAYYAAAWAASEPTEKEIADFVRYDGFKAKTPSGPAPQLPPAKPAEAPEPAAKP